MDRTFNVFNVNVLVMKNYKTDLIKENIAKERGYHLMKFWESEIKSDFESVKSKIIKEIQIRKIYEIN